MQDRITVTIPFKRRDASAQGSHLKSWPLEEFLAQKLLLRHALRPIPAGTRRPSGIGPWEKASEIGAVSVRAEPFLKSGRTVHPWRRKLRSCCRVRRAGG